MSTNFTKPSLIPSTYFLFIAESNLWTSILFNYTFIWITWWNRSPNTCLSPLSENVSLKVFGELNEEVQEWKWVWIIRIDELVVYGPCDKVDATFGFDVNGYDHVLVQLKQISFKHLVCDLLLFLIYILKYLFCSLLFAIYMMEYE